MVKKEQKRILIAAGPEGEQLARKALNGHDLHFASSLSHAKELLRDSEVDSLSLFDLIVAGVYFDDSRMFELLQYVRSVDHFDKLPFLVIKPRESELDGYKMPSPATKNTLQILGACDYVQLHDVPEEDACQLLLEAAENCFGKSIERERADQNGSPRLNPETAR
jgi:hypothetical protein